MLLIEPDYDPHYQTDRCYGCLFKGRHKSRCPKDKTRIALICAADYEINIWVEGPINDRRRIRCYTYAEPEELF